MPPGSRARLSLPRLWHRLGRLLSPFMPFLCEELWQRLPTCRGENDLVDPPSVTVAAYPVSAPFVNQAIEETMAFILDVVKVGVRALVAPRRVVPVLLPRRVRRRCGGLAGGTLFESGIPLLHSQGHRYGSRCAGFWRNGEGERGFAPRSPGLTRRGGGGACSLSAPRG